MLCYCIGGPAASKNFIIQFMMHTAMKHFFPLDFLHNLVLSSGNNS